MAARKIEKDGGGELLEPLPSKAQENKFSQAMFHMIDLMSRIYKNQVIKDLNQETIQKFADEVRPFRSYDNWVKFSDATQVGNYAVVFLRLAKKSERSLKARFSDDRIEKITASVLEEVDRRNRNQFYSQVEQQVGISAKELAASEGLRFKRNALELETAQWAKKLRDESLELYTSNTLRVMAEGGTLDDLLSEFDGMVEKRRNHAKMVSRTQVGTYNALVNKARSENLGITEAEWITAGDEAVRPCHAQRNGKTFKLSDGLFSSCDNKHLIPGQDYQCRCRSRYKIPEPEQSE